MIETARLLDRAARVIPAGTQTFSKARSQLPANAPSHILRGDRAHVWGSDGREYIDWTMALGAISLGYRDLHVEDAVMVQLGKGTIFGLAHPIEVELAEELVRLLPCPDAQVRFGKNGSDATAGAVRAARAITGRDIVVSQGYHGWQDWCCPNRTGIPLDTRYTTREYISPLDIGAPAAVIVEPEALGPKELEAIRAACDDVGALLIFDEILTGFRTPGFSYAAWSGVTPDLICFAKAIANGFPLSVIAGPEKYMRVFGGDIGYSFTFGGETLSLAAALATVRKMEREPVIAKLWDVGGRIRRAWTDEAWLSLGMPMRGLDSRLVVQYPSLVHRTFVSQEMFRRGIMWTVGATACYAHTDEDVERTCVAIGEVLELVAANQTRLADLVEGPVVSHPFRAMTP